jgi:uncharacterized protein YchJ
MAEKYRAFTQKATGRLREIHTDLKISVPVGQAAVHDGDPRLVDCKALWDTGATNSSITKSLAKKLGLKAVSIAQSHHAQGVTEVPVYVVDLYLPNKVKFAGVTVCEIADTVGGFDVLIGMDIITMGDFSITNMGGNTCVSFRIPSYKEVDFVADHAKDSMSVEQRLKATRPQNQNDPCDCGSGKKYKHCHGKV